MCYVQYPLDLAKAMLPCPTQWWHPEGNTNSSFRNSVGSSQGNEHNQDAVDGPPPLIPATNQKWFSSASSAGSTHAPTGITEWH